MKHAGPATLEKLANVLSSLRAMPGLVERKPGIFYRKSQAFLHFHEDPAGIFADVKLGGVGFERFPVNTAHEQKTLLQRIGDSKTIKL